MQGLKLNFKYYLNMLPTYCIVDKVQYVHYYFSLSFLHLFLPEMTKDINETLKHY